MLDLGEMVVLQIPDSGHDRLSPSNLCHWFPSGQRGVMRIRSSEPKSLTANSGAAAGTARMPPLGISTDAKPGPEIPADPPAANRY